MYVDGKKGSNIVELYGPTEVVDGIFKAGYNNDSVKCTFSYLGTSMKLVLSGTPLPFMKASVVEEILKRGFQLLSCSVRDDSLTFSRAVPL